MLFFFPLSLSLSRPSLSLIHVFSGHPLNCFSFNTVPLRGIVFFYHKGYLSW